MATRRRNLLQARQTTPLEVVARPVDTYVRPDIPAPRMDNTLTQLGEGLAAAIPGVASLAAEAKKDQQLKNEGLTSGAGGRLQDSEAMKQGQAALLRMDGDSLMKLGRLPTADQVALLKEQGVENAEEIVEVLRFQRIAGTLAARKGGYTDALYERFDEFTNPLQQVDLDKVLQEHRKQFFGDQGQQGLPLEFELGLTSELADQEEGFRKEVSRKRSERYLQEKEDASLENLTNSFEAYAKTGAPEAAEIIRADIVEQVGAGGRNVAQRMHEAAMNVALEAAANGDFQAGLVAYRRMMDLEVIPQYASKDDKSPTSFQALGQSAPIRSMRSRDIAQISQVARQNKEQKEENFAQASGAASRTLMTQLRDMQMPSTEQGRRRLLMAPPDDNPLFQASLQAAQEADPELDADEFYQRYWLGQGVNLALNFTANDREVDREFVQDLMLRVFDGSLNRDQLLDVLRDRPVDPGTIQMLMNHTEDSVQVRSAKAMVKSLADAEFGDRFEPLLQSEFGRNFRMESVQAQIKWAAKMSTMTDDQRDEYVEKTIIPSLQKMRAKYEPHMQTSTPDLAFAIVANDIRQNMTAEVEGLIQQVQADSLVLSIEDQALLKEQVFNFVEDTLQGEGMDSFRRVFKEQIIDGSGTSDPSVRSERIKTMLMPRVVQSLRPVINKFVKDRMAPFMSGRQDAGAATDAPSLGPLVKEYPVNGSTAASNYIQRVQSVLDEETLVDTSLPSNSEEVANMLGFEDPLGPFQGFRANPTLAAPLVDRQKKLAAYLAGTTDVIPPGSAKTRRAATQEYVAALTLSGLTPQELRRETTRHGVRFQDIGLSPLQAVSTIPILLGEELIEAQKEGSEFRAILDRLGFTDDKVVEMVFRRQNRLDEFRIRTVQKGADAPEGAESIRTIIDQLRRLRDR